MPAKNCHFADWLSEIEPILLNKSVLKKLDRDTHFMLLAFCFGWQASDEPCEQLGLHRKIALTLSLAHSLTPSLPHSLTCRRKLARSSSTSQQ